VHEQTWAADWEAALEAAVQGVAPVTEERRGTRIRDTRAVARNLGASAVALFARRGFDEVTVSEIAAQAGVTSRTFFRYFPSKETVVLDIWDQTNSRLVELIRTGAADDVLTTVTDAVVRWCEEYGELFSALTRMSDRSRSLAAAVLTRAVAWETRLAEALNERYPELDAEDAKVWGYLVMAMVRLSHRNVGMAGGDYAQAARGVFARLGSVVLRVDPTP
jgi:AcrR family transcriptional regulator